MATNSVGLIRTNEPIEDRDKWRNYVRGVANPQIEDGYRIEQKRRVYITKRTVE